MKFDKSNSFRKRIHELIPGGAHTYSKGDDQFPALAPAAIHYGKGAWVWDIDGNKFLDCSMGLTSVTLGHAFPPIIERIKEELDRGVNFQRPSYLELVVAEKFLSLVSCHDMVKFAKSGSIVTTAAVKLARAKTGRSLVAFPGDHPFYSYDDWFIGKTSCDLGVPDAVKELSVTFSSGDISSLKLLFKEYPNQIACVITEPEKNFDNERGINAAEFLKEAIELCHENGALFILDEMISGFKMDIPGAVKKFGITPDLATWGKSTANGFAFCALSGKREVMQLGSINNPGQEKVFLISTTHGAETSGLAAGLATMEFYESNDVIKKNNLTGKAIISRCREVLKRQHLEKYIQVSSTDWMPAFVFKAEKDVMCSGMRTLFMQEMIRKGVLFQGVFVPCFSHNEEEIEYFLHAFEKSCAVYLQALEEGYQKYLVGEPAKPVFRKYI